MRIIAGSLGGRQFDAPKSQRTHPMSDKMRAALFNVLGDITDLCILDAFAGSGALGFEALSRGAESVLAIEADKTAHKIIEANAQALGLRSAFKAVHATVAAWSNNNQAVVFDVVLADPPYDDPQESILQKLATHVKPAGLLALSWPGHKTALEFTGLQRLVERNYGDSQLVFYRKTP